MVEVQGGCVSGGAGEGRGKGLKGDRVRGWVKKSRVVVSLTGEGRGRGWGDRKGRGALGCIIRVV